jgi:hypothetical protein
VIPQSVNPETTSGSFAPSMRIPLASREERAESSWKFTSSSWQPFARREPSARALRRVVGSLGVPGQRGSSFSGGVNVCWTCPKMLWERGARFSGRRVSPSEGCPRGAMRYAAWLHLVHGTCRVRASRLGGRRRLGRLRIERDVAAEHAVDATQHHPAHVQPGHARAAPPRQAFIRRVVARQVSRPHAGLDQVMPQRRIGAAAAEVAVTACLVRLPQPWRQSGLGN